MVFIIVLFCSSILLKNKTKVVNVIFNLTVLIFLSSSFLFVSDSLEVNFYNIDNKSLTMVSLLVISNLTD